MVNSLYKSPAENHGKKSQDQSFALTEKELRFQQ